jgi:antirestriction protein ArdC
MSYVDNWLGPLKKDKRQTLRAVADAQKIVDMLLGLHPNFAATTEPHPDRPISPDANLASNAHH